MDLKVFEKQHFNGDIIGIDDIEEENNFEEIINEYIKKEKISLEDLAKNEKYVEEIIKILRRNSNISIRKISETLKINRPKIAKIIKRIN